MIYVYVERRGEEPLTFDPQGLGLDPALFAEWHTDAIYFEVGAP